MERRIFGIGVPATVSLQCALAQWQQTNGPYGGNAWTAPTGMAFKYGVEALASRGSTLLAGISKGVLKSTDGGVTWVQSDSGMGGAYVYSIMVNPSVVVAGTGIYAALSSLGVWKRAVTTGIAPPAGGGDSTCFFARAELS